MTTERRAVVLVGNPAAPYSRGLRIARLLAAGGFAVEIAAIAAAGLPEREEDGGIVIRRYRPRGPMARMTATYRDPATAGPRRRPPKFVGVPKRAAAALRRWAFWPHTVRGWWAALEAELPPADLYHACGSLTIAPALAARDRHASGPGGGPARVVYDAIDAVTESNNMLGLPAPVRRLIARRERGWARAADARITVNDPLARLLAARWGTARPAVVPNYPELRVRPEPGDRIRAALSLPASTRIVLFQGRLGPWLGIEEAERAILELPDTALVLLGFGRWEEQCRQRDTQPPFAGRHFTLPAVHPDALLAWTASADVSIIPLPAVSLNQRRSTPNKFWESLAAGTPVVLGPGLEAMEPIVREHALGGIAVSLGSEDLAAALAAVLDRPLEVRQAEGQRIAALAAERFAWPAAARTYRDLLATLIAPAAEASGSPEAAP